LISRRAFAAIDQEDRIGVSAISCWEVAMLVQKQRLQFDGPVLGWIREALSLPRIELLPISPEIAVSAAELADSLRDPADQTIVATAISHRCDLATKDRRIRESGLVKVIW
jgi:PIN domain nuclease of toxin-antitoxin system